MAENIIVEKISFQIRQLIDIRITEYLECDEILLEGLNKSVLYSMTGGKRVRSIFMFLVGELFDVPQEKLFSSACAIEMIHASSLIMDDLPYMDNAELRRGKPANHIVFGQDVALCASIALISCAIEILQIDETLDSKEKMNVTEIISKSYGMNGLAGGQFVDLKLKVKNVELEVLEFINARKTAALFSAAGKVAAILGNADEESVAKIAEYANNLGFTFQIIDDILDIKGDEKVVGKDLKMDKMNFAKLVGLKEAYKYAEDYMQKADEAISFFGGKNINLKTFGSYLLSRMK